MNKQHPSPPGDPPSLIEQLEDSVDAETAARMLHISPQTLRKWKTEGKGPRGYSLGRRYRYLREDIEQYLERQRFEPEATG